MKQPKKLHSQLDYSLEHTIPVVDPELSEYMTVRHEGLENYGAYDDFGDLDVKHIGSDVYLTNSQIDDTQFEEKSSSPVPNRKNSFLKKIFS